MTADRPSREAKGDAGEQNRGIGQEMIGEASSGPRQSPDLAPAAGGPGSGIGETRTSDDSLAPLTEEERAIRSQGLPQNG